MQFPEFAERTLENGARVIVVSDDEQPYVSVNLRIMTGTSADPVGLAGLAEGTATLLDKGTETRTAEEIAEAIDFVGASLGAGASDDWSSVTAGTVTQHLDDVLEVMADVVTNPTFPEEELEAERRRTLSGLQVALSQPGVLATRRFMAEVYGGHPYGASPTPESIQAITREDVVAFHEQFYVPENALFVIAGDVEADDVVARLDEHFADWEGDDVPAQTFPPLPAQQQRRLVFVNKPGSVQAVVRIGHLMPEASNDDWVEIDVMNQVLGGGVGGWMFRILRDQKGYTYGAYSNAVERQDDGYFWATAEVRNEVADSALDVMLELIQRLQDEPVPEQDLEEAKSYLSGSFPLDIETPQQVASRIATTLLLGRPADYLETYRDQVEATTATDVRFMAQQYLKPERSVVVVVGDAQQILAKVRPFADTVEVFDPEGRPIAISSLETTAPTLSYDLSSIEPETRVYSLAFRGNPIGEATSTITRETGPQGEPVIRSSTTIQGPMQQTQEVVFEADGFRPISASIAGGPLGVDMALEDGRVEGEVRAPGQPAQAIDVAYEEGLLLPGMDEFAIAVTDLDRHRLFRIPIVTQAGVATSLRVRVVGETTIDVPAGSFDVYELEVSGPQSMTLFVRKQAPHIVVRQLLPEPPISIELQEIR
ncbi:MAG: M16 family metallopeptidase [Longimicrobiales bacterium]